MQPPFSEAGCRPVLTSSISPHRPNQRVRNERAQRCGWPSAVFSAAASRNLDSGRRERFVEQIDQRRGGAELGLGPLEKLPRGAEVLLGLRHDCQSLVLEELGARMIL